MEYINFLLNLKLASLKRDHLDSLTFKQLKDYIYNSIWFSSVPSSLNKIADDINSITIEEIVDYLTAGYSETNLEGFEGELNEER